MKAISIKYIGPSNVRGSRYKAYTDSHSVVVSSDSAMNAEGNAIEAAKRLAAKLGWSGRMILGGTKDGWVAVFANGESFDVGGGSKPSKGSWGGLNQTHGRRNRAGGAASANDAEVRELVLFIENDEPLYRQRWQPILKNLANKKAQGKYDREKAIKLFMYLMEDGAKRYSTEFGGVWNQTFNVPTRKAAAREFAENFEAEYKTGAYDNYLTKVSAKAKSANPNRAGGRRGRR